MLLKRHKPISVISRYLHRHVFEWEKNIIHSTRVNTGQCYPGFGTEQCAIRLFKTFVVVISSVA